MARFKITGFPDKEPSKPTTSHTLGAVNRNIANVEAEKGETVVTNMSRGLNNIYEMYDIGGKKHSEGGTPLALPTDTSKDTDGTSFIFSDNKRMIVKDPAILEYFGVSPKKPKTFADISKTWLDAINKSKEILISDDADKITKKSAEMSMDNAAFKIAALKLLQESRKGFKDGIPNGLNPFFDKLQLDPSQMFAMDQQDADNTNQAVAKAFGGMARDFVSMNEQYPFPSLSMGGELPRYPDGASVTPENNEKKVDDGLVWGTSNNTSKVQYEYVRDVLGNSPGFKKALYAEYLKAAEQPDNFGKRYNKQLSDRGKIVKMDPEQVYQDYLDFQRRNLMLQSHGLDVAATEQNPGFDKKGKPNVSNKTITDWTNKHGVPLPDIDGAASQQLSYIAFENLSKAKDSGSYSEELKEILKPFGATQRGTADEKIAGSTAPGTISKSDGAYTNTSAGEISFFTAPEEKPEDPKTPPGTTPPPTPAIPDTPEYKRLGQTQQLVNPYGFRRQDIASLNRALQAKFEIPELHPWAKSAEVVLPDRTYYSPERAIAAKNEQLNQMMQSASAFGTAQNIGATATGLAGQAYADVANIISDYADKNVGIFNQGEQYNAQLANARNERDAQLSTNMYDKENILKQSLANSIGAAKDKIVELGNQAWTNAADIYNLNTTTENFKKDPFSGIITKMNDRAITPNKDASKDFGEEFNTFSKSMPTVSPDLQMKAFLAYKSGKYTIEPDDNVIKPTELRNENVT